MTKFKLFGLLLSAIGISFASCAKEKDCKCTDTSTYTYDGVTETETNDPYTVTTKLSCDKESKTITMEDGADKYVMEKKCEKK